MKIKLIFFFIIKLYLLSDPLCREYYLPYINTNNRCSMCYKSFYHSGLR